MHSALDELSPLIALGQGTYDRLECIGEVSKLYLFFRQWQVSTGQRLRAMIAGYAVRATDAVHLASAALKKMTRTPRTRANLAAAGVQRFATTG